MLINEPRRLRRFAINEPRRLRRFAIDEPRRLRRFAIDEPRRLQRFAIDEPRRLQRFAIDEPRRLRAAWALVLLVFMGCKAEDALILAVRAPDGTQAKSYAVRIQDRHSRQVVYYSGVKVLDMPRDLSATPLRLGLSFDQHGDFLIHVIAANVVDVESLPAAGSKEPMLFFAGLLTADGVSEVDVPLLPVPPEFDVDRDHFPDGVSWRAQFPDADALYHDHPELLDCLDQDPHAGDLSPATLRAFDVHPMARNICNAQLRPQGGAGATTQPPLQLLDVTCAGTPQPCLDNDADGDPANTDCDDSDPRRFHGNPRPRNCCQCTDRASCKVSSAAVVRTVPNVGIDKDPGFKMAMDKLQRADLGACQPSRCDTNFDYDCTGHSVSCFVDEDCDGYAANDPDPSLRDCDDHDPRVHPRAKKDCNPDPGDVDKDWACDRNPQGGCVPCDLDGDGFQRIEKDGSCPTKVYVLKHGQNKDIDCDDTDSGVFPGSSAFQSPGQIFKDLDPMSRSGSVVAALRGLCSSTELDGKTSLNTNCDDVKVDPNKPRKGCPPASCDQDHDGFPNSNDIVCNPNGLPLDCDDNDPHTFPGAPQFCHDKKDHDCDHIIDTCANGDDVDNDGYGNRYDCNDNDPNIHPWAPELCNGVDDNCDGIIDEHNPGDLGKPLVEAFNGAKVIKSCADNKLGDCGLNVTRNAITHHLGGQPSGAYSGRCVCSSLQPSSMINPDATKRADCAAPSTGATTPKCFGAIQPEIQSCDSAANDADEDCDGFTDDPTGANPLQEKGLICGVTRANSQCSAGTVLGCLRDVKRPNYPKTPYLNPFSSGARPATAFGRPAIDDKGIAFDETGKFLVCKTGSFAPPQGEICNGIDDDCDGYLYGAVSGDNVQKSMAELDLDQDGYLACQCDKSIDTTIQSPKNFTLGPLNTNCTDPQNNPQACTKLNLLGCGDCNDSDSTVYPSVFKGTAAKELCDNQSNKCLLSYLDGSEDCAGLSCCSSQKSCRNLKTDKSNCGTCGMTCDANYSNQCFGSGCVCGGVMTSCDKVMGANFCLPANNNAKCVQCRSTDDCKTYPTLALLKCNSDDAGSPTLNTCVQCNQDGDCAAKQHCQAHFCTACTKATQTGDCTAPKAFCLEAAGNPLQNKCAQCNDNTQCMVHATDQCSMDGICLCHGKTCGGATPACLAGTGCVECTLDGDCTGNANGPACDMALNKCVPCLKNATESNYCSSPKAHCLEDADSSAKNKCAACNDPMQCDAKVADKCTAGVCMCQAATACSGAAPACKAAKGCVQCKVPDDCKNVMGKPECDTNTNKCVPCLVATEAADCKVTGLLHCAVNADTMLNKCARCAIDKNCPAGNFCDTDFTCKGCNNADHCGATLCNVCTGSGEPICTTQQCVCSKAADCSDKDTCTYGVCTHTCTAADDCAKAGQGNKCVSVTLPADGGTSSQCGCNGDGDCAFIANTTCVAHVCTCGGTVCKNDQMCSMTGVCM